ncbi:MAG: tRNA pseudouridine(13) synthase TruD [Steroidobacteraceae bacterium]
MDHPCAWGEPLLSGRLRVEPEDFVVEEVLGFRPDDAGGHVLVLVEKRDANTGWVAAQLARAADCAVRDVGWSGHKDRRAVARQWFSLPWSVSAPTSPFEAVAGEGYKVIAVHRHGRKLRPGSHRSNRFVIRVRDANAERGRLGTRLETIARDGVPNYFGPQRYGREGANLERARQWATGGTAPRDRTQRGFALSTARSELFNRVVAERVRRGDWNRLLPGEAVMLDGRRSWFRAEVVDEALAARCAALDLHPTGPLWGRGDEGAAGEAREVELAAVAGEPGLAALLESQGLEAERRSLRLPVRGLEWSLDGSDFRVGFELPRGTFATSVLHEVLAGAWDGHDSSIVPADSGGPDT